MADKSDLDAFDAATKGGLQRPLTTNPPAAATKTTDLAAFDAATQGSNINLPPTTLTATPRLSFEERNARRDDTGNLIPFDVKRGLGAPLAQWRIAQQQGPEAKLAVLQNIYPNNKARILPNGELTVELTDSETGQPKEVFIDAEGLDATTLMELAAEMPAVAAGVAAAAAIGPVAGPVKLAGQMVLSALATGTWGSIIDAASRTSEGIPVEGREIFARRGSQAIFDMFLDAGLAGGAKLLPYTASPFNPRKPSPMEFDVDRGRAYFKDAYGIDLTMTPAERTGSPALQALEAMESQQPGARTLMKRYHDRSQAEIADIQRIAAGQVVPEEQLGTDIISDLRRDLVEPFEQAVTKAREAASAAGNRRLEQLLNNSTGMVRGARPVTRDQSGAVTLEQFDQKLAAASSKVDDAYAKVRALPGGSGDVLDGTPAAQAAASIRAELPQSNGQVLKSGVPEGLLPALADLESLNGKMVSLDTLTNMKKAAHDAIAAFKTAHGDAKDRWFTRIASAYQQGIDAGVAATGNPALKQALADAKETYKRELLPFERPGLKELAKDEFDTARLAPEQVFDRFFNGPKAIENYRMLKEVLGPSNPAFRVMKRAWADRQLALVTDPVTRTINPDQLATTIRTMKADSLELAEELFGKNLDELEQTLTAQSALKRPKLDEEEVRALLMLKNPRAADLQTVLRAQQNRDQAYVNSILSDIADGLPLKSKLNASDVITKLNNTSTPSTDVQEIMSAIGKSNPTLRRQIANRQFYNLLDAASIREAATAGKLVGGEPLRFSPTKLADALGRPGSPERLRNELLLGTDPIALPMVGSTTAPTRIETLEQLVKTFAGREMRSSAFSGAGGIAAGAVINKLTNETFKYASSYVKKALYTAIYLNPQVTKLLSNRVFTPAEAAALANTLIVFEPFIGAMIDLAGDEAPSLISQLKSSIDRSVADLMDTPEGREEGAVNRFMKGEQVPMKVQAE